MSDADKLEQEVIQNYRALYGDEWEFHFRRDLQKVTRECVYEDLKKFWIEQGNKLEELELIMSNL